MSKIQNEAMIDIETLSTKRDAIIVSIACIKFSRYDKIKTFDDYDKFYRRVNISSCKDIGLREDKETLDWWKTQPRDIRYEALENPEDRVGIHEALYDLSLWITDVEKIWANGPDFDCVILTEAYNKCKLDIPWKFWNTRDCRTLFDISNISKFDLPQDKIHNSLYDCYRQIIGINKSMKKLQLI